MKTKEENLTQEELKKLFYYDTDTGGFIWNVSRSSQCKIGDEAGYIQRNKSTGKSYRTILVNGKTYLAHRLVFLYITGAFPDDQVDHINGDGCDNRWINLRCVSNTENRRNIKLFHNNKSGVCGVIYCLNKYHNDVWYSYIRINKILINLGYFKSLFDAVCARKNAELKYGFHRNHGSIRAL